MRIHRRFDRLPRADRGACVAIGNFDGVHLGHRAVIAAAAALARELGGAPLGVVTFEPHPREVLSPGDAPARLTPFRAKAELLGALGVEACVALPFGPALMALPPEAFAREVLVGRLGARGVAAGEDFRFGRGRSGDMAGLRALGRELGFAAAAVPGVAVDGRPCSSSRVRALLAEGEVAAAARALGRPHEVRGVVRAGEGRGRGLGYPTANVRPLGRRAPLPGAGIYVVRAGLEAGGPGGRPGAPAAVAWHDAVASLGTNPTFGGAEGGPPRLEVHLLGRDFGRALYGRRMRVAFLERLRGEARFDGAAALVEQMDRDRDAALATHAARGAGPDRP